MINIFKSLAIFLVTATPAFALPSNPVPEPETLALIAVGAVAAILASRRKKKK